MYICNVAGSQNTSECRPAVEELVGVLLAVAAAAPEVRSLAVLLKNRHKSLGVDILKACRPAGTETKRALVSTLPMQTDLQWRHW